MAQPTFNVNDLADRDILEYQESTGDFENVPSRLPSSLSTILAAGLAAGDLWLVVDVSANDDAGELKTITQAELASQFDAAGTAAGAVAAHVAAADPHPQYLTAAEGNAAYQPLDADLTAISALTGEGYAQRTTLGAWIVSSTIPWSHIVSVAAPLDALQSLSPAADRLAYYTGATTASLTVFTAAGRALLDDADAAAQRTTLGLGTAATASTSDFASASHTHDDRYYTESEVDSLIGAVVQYSDEKVDDRVAALLQEGSGVTWSYNDGAGTLTPAVDHGGIGGLGDDDHTQYHTDARALTWLGTRSTSDLPEGSNLYYTAERVDDRVAALLVEGSGISLTYDDGANTLTIAATGGGGGGAPDDAQYLVGASNGTLTQERVVTDTATVAWDLGTGGQAKANVPDEAITYAKMQHVSASDRLLGRVSSGAGDVEEVTCTDFAQSLLDDADAAAGRTTLGLGTISTQAADSVTITGGSIAGITDLALADGGTGASLSDPGADRVMAWDDSASEVKFIPLSDLNAEGSPAAGDFLLAYTAEGALVKVDWDDLPAGGGGSAELPRGYIDGLITSNAADADHDITIAVGSARDSTDSEDIVLGSTITKQIDAAWSVGTNAGGLDTGSVANSTWYHVWLIKRSDTGVVDALFSTSVTAPTMPANYDYKRRIGSVLTNGSANIIAFKQTGELWYWMEPVVDVSVTTSPTAFTLATLTVPLGIVTEAVVRIDCSDTATSLATVWHGNQTTPAAVSSGLGFPRNPSTSTVTQGATIFVFTDLSSRIYYAASLSTADVSIRAMGWRDTRGRNS